MYGYISWPGVYSFKQEIGMFMEYLREQIDEVMKVLSKKSECSWNISVNRLMKL